MHTATRLSTLLCARRPPLLACAIGEDPPLARPRPRELVIRLEEDRAHASLGQAPPADFCNTTRRTGTPSSSQSSSVNCGRPQPHFPPLLAQRRRTHVRHRAFPLSRTVTRAFARMAVSVKTSRASRSRRLSPPRVPARAEGARAKDSPFDGRAPLLERSLEHPGRRILASGGLETPPRGQDTAKIPFRRRPAKDDGFRKIEVLCAASEPIEQPCYRLPDFLECAARLLP